MLTIAQRRSISNRCSFDQAFRRKLGRDPRAALAEALGSSLPSDETVEVLEESPSRWAFVLPEIDDIEPDLPPPTDPRSAIENEIYSALREEPETIETAARDPRAFLLERFGVEVNGVDLRREFAGTTVVVIPHQSAREELDDEMLDMVAAGGNVPLNNAENTGSAK
jgi:hypothetical protein